MAITTKNSQPSKTQIGRYIQQHNLRGVVEIGAIVLVAILVAFLVRTFLLQLFYIPSPSMEPYLKTDDKVFVNKLSYTFNDVERGDVVVFKAPKAIHDESVAAHAINNSKPVINDLIKRVIGLPGETIEGKCADPEETKCAIEIYIDGKKLNEPYIGSDVIYAPFTSDGPVPQGSYFMMGDNRANSEDSRFPQVGFIPKNDMVGRAFFRLWPANGFGFL